MSYLHVQRAAFTCALLLQSACTGDEGADTDTDTTTTSATEASTTEASTSATSSATSEGTTDTETGTGTDTDPTGDPTEDPEGAGCGEETVTVLDDLSQIPAGFTLSPDQLLDGALGPFGGAFTWSQSDGPFTSAHAGTSSPLTMSIIYEGGEARLIEVERHGGYPNGQEGGVPCSNTVEIDLLLDFATEDGLFNESQVEATLRIDAYGWEGDNERTLIWQLDFGSLVGALKSSDFSFDSFTIESFWMQIGYPAEAQSTGALIMESHGEQGTPVEGIVGVGPVGGFNADAIP
ncbi:MAG: hypothetical protein IPK80_29135 [Nannocystis sp.]|nr:hypothetical protein [Nannocystis sp.]